MGLFSGKKKGGRDETAAVAGVVVEPGTPTTTHRSHKTPSSPSKNKDRKKSGKSKKKNHSNHGKEQANEQQHQTAPQLKPPPPPPPQSEPAARSMLQTPVELDQSAMGLEASAAAAALEVTREAVKRFISDIWNRGEIELIPIVCHPSLRFNGHVGMDKVGHEGFARMVTTVREALTDYHCEIHSMVVESNKAFCRLRFTGKHTGDLLGYQPTGRTVAWMGASEFTCKNGKILKVWELGDVKSLEEQLRS